jgi:Zn-dependent protease
MEGFPNWPPSWSVLLYLPALFVGFTVHELAHALVAYALGDTSQVERKRLSFNPLRHISWLGTVVFLLFGFAWAKPVWVDRSRLRIQNQAFGTFLVSIAGVSANFLLAMAVLVGMIATAIVTSAWTGGSVWDVIQFLAAPNPELDPQGIAVALSSYVLVVNLVLTFFNLLPLPSLDGFLALTSLYLVLRDLLKGSAHAVPARHPPVDTSPGDEPALTPAQIHFDIGLEYHQEGQFDEAIARYRQAIAHDEQFALAYYNQGLAYWAKGRMPLAISAFRAASETSGDMNVRVQAGLRLQELIQAEQDPEVNVGPAPPPLEPGTKPQTAGDDSASLDPAVQRQVWLRLALGGAAMLLVAIAAWLYVTAVTLMAFN